MSRDHEWHNPTRPSHGSLGLVFGEVATTYQRKGWPGWARLLGAFLGSAVFWVPVVVLGLAFVGRR